jgi:hypothetical protein
MPKNLRKEAIQAYKLTEEAIVAVNKAADAYRAIYNALPKKKRDDYPYETMLGNWDEICLRTKDANWMLDEAFNFKENEVECPQP